MSRQADVDAVMELAKASQLIEQLTEKIDELSGTGLLDSRGLQAAIEMSQRLDTINEQINSELSEQIEIMTEEK